MAVIDSFLFGIPINAQTALISVLLILIVFLIRRGSNQNEERKTKTPSQKERSHQTLDLIVERRTIMPKEFISGSQISEEELNMILEAANWAPTHQKNEPWRYSILCSPNEIEKYLDFLDNWYENHQSELQSGELEKFKNKVEGVRKEWPFKVSHLVLLGMRRQSKPDKRLPEWEEICAVAMSVQNMHLMTTALDHVGAFWSSHTWCKAARDSSELRKEYFGDLLPDSEDRVFGALVLGKYPEGKKYRSTRTEMSTKVVFRK